MAQSHPSLSQKRGAGGEFTYLKDYSTIFLVFLPDAEVIGSGEPIILCFSTLTQDMPLFLSNTKPWSYRADEDRYQRGIN